MIQYKGYSALLEVKEEDGVIAGRVLGIRDVVTFEGETVAEAEQAFRDSVDDYLAFCAERGVKPDKPFSGKFVVRIPPELHRALAVTAESQRMSLNAFVESTLAATVGRQSLRGDPSSSGKVLPFRGKGASSLGKPLTLKEKLAAARSSGSAANPAAARPAPKPPAKKNGTEEAEGKQ